MGHMRLRNALGRAVEGSIAIMASKEEYHLTPDELIAKDFRRIQSSRRRYRPYCKSDWIGYARSAEHLAPGHVHQNVLLDLVQK